VTSAEATAHWNAIVNELERRRLLSDAGSDFLKRNYYTKGGDLLVEHGPSEDQARVVWRPSNAAHEAVDVSEMDVATAGETIEALMW
jgi:hypothetical protein